MSIHYLRIKSLFVVAAFVLCSCHLGLAMARTPDGVIPPVITADETSTIARGGYTDVYVSVGSVVSSNKVVYLASDDTSLINPPSSVTITTGISSAWVRLYVTEVGPAMIGRSTTVRITASNSAGNSYVDLNVG